MDEFDGRGGHDAAYDAMYGGLSPTQPPSADGNYRQIGKRKGHGRLLLGAAHSYHASTVAAAASADPSFAASTGSVAASFASAISSVPSIPSRFETVLYAGEQEPDAFNSRVSRFKQVAVDLPGPGSYSGDVLAPGGFGESGGPGGALRLASASWSTKGLGVGFVSKAPRFGRSRGGPGPASYDVLSRDSLGARASSAPHRGSEVGSTTSAFRVPQSTALNPALAKAVQNNHPGPGYYDITGRTKVKPLTGVEARRAMTSRQAGSTASTYRASSASSLAAQFQSRASFSQTSPLGSSGVPPALFAPAADPLPAFSSSDARFRNGILGAAGPGSLATKSNVGPGSYEPFPPPRDTSPQRPDANFRSTTERTDFTHNPSVPGPGWYAKGGEESKSNDEAWSSSPASPTRPFRQSNLDRFGRVVQPRVPPEISPGPGHFDPYIPGARRDSPTRGGPAAAMLGPRLGPKHPPPLLHTPLEASQSHGVPVDDAYGGGGGGIGPEARLAGRGSGGGRRKKKRAAGVGGPGKSLLATRGGPGVALSAPGLLLNPPASSGTFGRAGAAPLPSPLALAASFASPQTLGQVEVQPPGIRPPGPAWYKSDEAFHKVHDRKTFHLNTEHRWM